jgi:hypothetical protein
MIVFGGANNAIYYGHLYILDLPSMKWTKGRSAPEPRSSMACTVAGDNFISWGGNHFISALSLFFLVYQNVQPQYVFKENEMYSLTALSA